MIAVTQRLEGRPVERRMCAFPDIFGMTDRRSKGTKSRCKPRCRFRVTSGELGNDWSVKMFVKECRKSGIVGWQERVKKCRRISYKI